MTSPSDERALVLETLRRTAGTLARDVRPALIPPGGIGFGYAIRGARDKDGVAAVTGRIPGAGDRQASLPCGFGTDEPLARIILTAAKFDPQMRSAACIAWSLRAKTVLSQDMFLESGTAGGDQPRGTGTLDWGIASCCRDCVPDVIFWNERDPARSRIILLGEDPADVLNNIIICSNRI